MKHIIILIPIFVLFISACSAELEIENSSDSNNTQNAQTDKLVASDADSCKDYFIPELNENIEHLNDLTFSQFKDASTPTLSLYSQLYFWSQVSLATDVYTSTLIEQSGLDGLTSSRDWLYTFCQLESDKPTFISQVTYQKNYLTDVDYLNDLDYFFVAQTTENDLSPQDEWRFNTDLRQQIQAKFNVQQTTDVYFEEEQERLWLDAIVVAGNTKSFINEEMQYYSVQNEESTIRMHIIVPQPFFYHSIKNNLQATLLNSMENAKATNNITIPIFKRSVEGSIFSNMPNLSRNTLNFDVLQSDETLLLKDEFAHHTLLLDSTGSLAIDSVFKFTLEAEQTNHNTSSVNTELSFVNFMPCHKTVNRQAWYPFFVIFDNPESGVVYVIQSYNAQDLNASPVLCDLIEPVEFTL
ncbi:hypothetical protein [Catenovulum sediminis]|uniref:hypothetical protein n=1 Tax=Catenovulum sediminis TaxID=1740262 RepID=UPI00117D475D|nr:hypothetical protein [Catenovulum sediminis]